MSPHSTTQQSPLHQPEKIPKIGVYQLVCKDCNRKYTGQTGRSFRTRFKEYFRDYKYTNGKYNFAQRLIDNNYMFSRMEGIINIAYITKKGKLMDTLGRFHIYDETKINDKNTLHQNIIFDIYFMHLRIEDTPPTRTTYTRPSSYKNKQYSIFKLRTEHLTERTSHHLPTNS